MNSLILQTATRLIHPLMFFFSIFIFLRGHNAPGGGFVGGLIAAAGFALYTIAADVSSARRALRIQPEWMIGTGLLLAGVSGLVGLITEQAFMTGVWTGVKVAYFEPWDVGTPFLFDLGVYLLVWGVALLILFSLSEEMED